MVNSNEKLLDRDLERKIRAHINNNEETFLSEFASKSVEAKRKRMIKRDIRTEYTRDTDRIMSTYAYSRYIDKTQVFFLVNNDHITHRVLHVQLVSKIAKTIGRALGLNEDLIEAIALGHDIGHVPYGHLGEKFLSELCKKNGIKGFSHNAQSVQFLDEIEDRNLTLQVLDGILCHNGEVHNKIMRPNRNKDWAIFYQELGGAWDGHDCTPMTLEGCVVRFSDRIAYLGRDIQDAVEIGLIENASDVPVNCKEVIGTKNNVIINNLVVDIITNSYGQDYIAYSTEISNALDEYKDFNLKNIYLHPKLLAESGKIKTMFSVLFSTFLDDLNKGDKSSKIYADLIDLEWINKDYISKSSRPEKVRDYIAGMTDRYFEKVFGEYLRIVPLPKRVHTYKEIQLNN